MNYKFDIAVNQILFGLLDNRKHIPNAKMKSGFLWPRVYLTAMVLLHLPSGKYIYFPLYLKQYLYNNVRLDIVDPYLKHKGFTVF